MLHSEVRAPVLCLQVKCITLQVLKGLQYLHENYIIHRWGSRTNVVGKGEMGLMERNLPSPELWGDSSPPVSWHRQHCREKLWGGLL